MGAGLARSDLHTLYKAGAGKLREHALVFGDHVIAIGSIGSITLVEHSRTWWLALLGLLIAAGAAYAVNIYGSIAWGGVGLGAAAIVANLLSSTARHISIGTSDGHITTIHSSNSAFLRRLFDLLSEKINSQSTSLLASFDIADGTLSIASQPPAKQCNPSSESDLIPTVREIITSDTNRSSDASNDPTIQPLSSAADVDETLFANDPEPSLKPRATNDEDQKTSRFIIPASQAAMHDPLLDGPSIAPPRIVDDLDWITHADAAQTRRSGGRTGAGPWVLFVLLLAILAGGAATVWQVLHPADNISAVPLLTHPPVEDASFKAPPSSPTPSMTPAPTQPAEPMLAPPVMEPAAPIAPLAAAPEFATSTPHILEPAGGVHLSGGPQLVRFAWSSLREAQAHVLEIEAFNEGAQTWTDAWGPGRVTTGTDNEAAENIPAAGRWRWRVRGVAAAGEQSKFSAWSEFSVDD